MKWFKHFSDAHQHPKIRALIKQFGAEGYYICFTTFEIISHYGNHLRLSLKKYSLQEFSDVLKIPKEIIESIWKGMAEKGLLDPDAYKRGYLYSRKLKEYADEYTQKLRTKSRHTPDTVGTKSPIEVEVEQKEKKKEKKKKMSFNFPTFEEAHNPEFMDFLKEAYPDVHVGFEFKRMETWLSIHPEKRYKNYGKFCRGWIDRAGKGFQDQPPEPDYIQHVFSKEELRQTEEDRLKAQEKLEKSLTPEAKAYAEGLRKRIGKIAEAKKL